MTEPAGDLLAERPRVVRPSFVPAAAGGDGSTPDPEGTFLVIALVTPLLVGVCRLVQTFTVMSSNVAVGIVGAGFTGLVALACSASWVSMFWKTRSATDVSRRYMSVLLVSLAAIAVSIEAFAGVTTVLWQHHLLTADAARGPDLWAAERLYLWHVANSIPLLGIPKAVGWSDPNLFNNSLFGALILSFKILLIAPLVRIGLTTYQATQNRYTAIDQMVHDEADQGLVARRPYPLPNRRTTLHVLTIVIIVYAVLTVAFNSRRFVDQWVIEHLAHGGLAWTRTGLQWAIVLIGPLIIWFYFRWFISFRMPFETTRWTQVASDLVGYLGVVGLFVAYGVAWLLVLFHVGLVSSNRTIPDGTEVGAAASAFAWHIADALPGPNIPQTLRWTIDYDFVGRTASIVYLLVKLVVFGILLLKAGRLIRSMFYRVRRQEVAMLAAVGRCAAAMERVRKGIDEIEWKTVGSSTGLQPQEDRGPDHSVWSLREEYWQTVLVEVKEITSVFGAGEVTRRANSAAAAARRRLEAIERLEGAMKFENHIETLKILTHRGEYVTKGSMAPAAALLPRLRATERRRINDFRSSAANALRVTADEVDGLFADVDDEPGRDSIGSSEPSDMQTKTTTNRRE